MSDAITVMCAGDLFITSEALAEAARQHITAALPDTALSVVSHASRWPDEPFGDIEGVREAAGDVTALAESVRGAHVLLTHLAPITGSVLAAAPDLRLVGVTRGGPVNVDVAAATLLGIPVAYLPGRNLSAVAEFVVGTMITVMRNIGPASIGMTEGRWDGSFYRYERCGPELGASTVGLVGLGAVGARVATLLSAFGARVLAHDPFADPTTVDPAVRLVDLPELLATSNVVSVHARLTPQTRGMFDKVAFAAMPRGAYFVNTARGELVDTDALTEALASGHLAGAALDVFDPEPPPGDHPLRGMPNVLATPHLAGASQQTATVSAGRIAEAAAGFLVSGRLTHCVNPEVLTPVSGG